ncbi:MAG: low molecular weight protein arginine phosphatase [Candidatus Eisenbacteria bacterium]|uniref:Low molecular weight protein arginine phosphatase n=1 Tax=Eiseniibacteriota bacterium TaxID=2212470 RepID=A0A948W6E1_UNCEI|nr:low molecular weight protein arginine phosphatase [Candidatus Eisenbacteria bacterium]MBU1951089.1 low molecular weight protein arginine phosphatase [Candidatus Eisenbacteria bacterium]MBU2690551.1 low molecular weight protein arginine phosphatase [Candidatus Eisenbacteria bacterium]
MGEKLFHVMVVCTGNICRSPIGEGLLTHRLRDLPVLVDSAGTAAPEGVPASQHGVDVCAERGLDISKHRSRLLTRTLLGDVDLVLVMEPYHQMEILTMAPDLADRVFIITEFVGEGDEGVGDPIGAGRYAYEETYAILERLTEKADPLIREMVNAKTQAGETHS